MAGKPFEGYGTSWTQPYLPTSYNPFYEPAANTIAQEMAEIERIDARVDSMTEYPDAAKILDEIRKRS